MDQAKESREMGLKIDVHHHIFPPENIYPKAAMNGKLGWRTPEENLPWSPEKSLAAMDKLGVQLAVLSYPAGVPSRKEREGVGILEENRKAARELNEYARQICEEGPGRGRFGWMACLPDLRDVQGALEELTYALDVLGADGVSLSSSYRGTSGSQLDHAVYIADDKFDPLWEELDRRGETVFLHGTQVVVPLQQFAHPFLGIPITEVPNETFKAAAHLVVTGKKRRFSRVKIVLAHLGGSAPFLAPRVAVLSGHMGCTLTPEECIEDFSSFFFDTALSAHESTLSMSTMRPERLLFGTDFPAVSTNMAAWYTRNVDEYYAQDAAALAAVTRDNALRIFPRLRTRIQGSQEQ